MRLKWKRTGMPSAIKKHDYLMEYYVKDKCDKLHVQCNFIVLITMKKAKEQAKVELKVESRFLSLFGLDSSQSQRSNNSPSPPP